MREQIIISRLSPVWVFHKKQNSWTNKWWAVYDWPL